MKYIFATGNFVFHVLMKNKVSSKKGVQVLRGSFASLFMAKKNVKMWRWQAENAVEMGEVE